MSMYTDEQHAENLLTLLLEMGVNDAVSAQHPTLDGASFDLTQSNDPKIQALGYCLGLTAILETPDALRMAVQELRSRLGKGLAIVW